MTPEELREYGERLKSHYAKSIDSAIAQAIRYVYTKGEEGHKDSICMTADQVGENLRFELLDFLEEYGLG